MKFWTEKRILWGLILFYIIFFSVFTSIRHYNFQTQAWDMGIFNQLFWNTSHGKGMSSTLEEIPNHMGIHFSPFLFILTLGYFLFSSPYFLLIIQTIALGLGALPLYLLAKKILKNEKLALLVSGGYLLYPSLHWVNVFDFHEISFLIPLLFSALYFLEIKKWLWAGLFLAFSASVKEDAILAVLFVGIYLLVKQDNQPPAPIRQNQKSSWWNAQRKMGAATILLAALLFFLSVQIIMPALGGGLLRLDRYGNMGGNPAEIIGNILKNPGLLASAIFNVQKLRYLFWLFLPVLFLPLLSWRTLALLIPGLAENLLTDFESQFAGFYQYDAIIIPAIFIGAIYGVKYLAQTKNLPIFKIKWLILAAMLTGYFVRSPVNPVFFPTDLFKSNPRWDAYRQMVKLTPPNVSVSAHTNLTPHLSGRPHIYMLGKEPFPTDYILINAADMFGFADEESFNRYFDDYLNSGNYNLRIIDGKYIILSTP